MVLYHTSLPNPDICSHDLAQKGAANVTKRGAAPAPRAAADAAAPATSALSSEIPASVPPPPPNMASRHTPGAMGPHSSNQPSGLQCSHAVHDAAPGESANWPAAHSSHRPPDCTLANRPAGHLLHSVRQADAPKPAGQGWHDTWDAFVTVPDGHGSHVVPSVKLPGGQSWHGRLDCGVNFPSGHLAQLVAPRTRTGDGSASTSVT